MLFVNWDRGPTFSITIKIIETKLNWISTPQSAIKQALFGSIKVGHVCYFRLLNKFGHMIQVKINTGIVSYKWP